LTERLAQYEPEVRRESSTPDGTMETPGASYSVDAEINRRRRRRRTRTPSAAKVHSEQP